MTLVVGAALLLTTTGCQTNKNQSEFKDVKELMAQNPRHGTNAPTSVPPANAGTNSESIVIREGDTLKIMFLGSPNLNKTVAVRRDGKIQLDVVGDVSAAGLTPVELEKALKDKYKDQIAVNEITVQVETDFISIYVSGMVMHAQKVVSNHPMTALQAIMEAGGPDYTKANLKKVTVLRKGAGKVSLDLKKVLSGQSEDNFYLKDGDMIYVPERFSWF